MKSFLITLLCFGLFMAYGLHDDNVQKEKRIAEVMPKWNAWLAYRDKNCKVSERIYGLSETSGKFHQNDNATVYDCGNVRIVIAQSVENRAKTQDLYLDDIPRP